MKGILVLGLSAWVLLFAGCALRPSGERPERFSTETYVVTPDTGVWDAEYGRTREADDCSFSFRVVRYDDGIGVFAEVTDNNCVCDDCVVGDGKCAAWNDDSLQVFFDGDLDGSTDARAGSALRYGGQFSYVANGAAESFYSGRPNGFGTDWTGSAVVSTNATGSIKIHYQLWFSWNCLGRLVPPCRDEDVSFGFNIAVHDDDDGGRGDRALYWKGTPNLPYRNESAFGRLVLKGSRAW